MKQKKVKRDLTGQKYGRLTVIGLADTGTRKTYWVCKCDCGNIKTIRSDSLTSGRIKSCGCLKKEQDIKNLSANHSHKMSGTRIYQIWQGIKGRCNNIHNTRFHRYGGRGIKVCKEWENDFSSFYTWAINNGYADDLTIDRIDNDRGYAPDNCRWSTPKGQCNNRETNIKITIGNATKSLTEWCEIFELNPKTVMARYNRIKSDLVDDLFNR